MREQYTLGTVAGLRLSARPSAVGGSMILGVLGSLVARRRGLAPGRALAAGGALVGLHWAGELWHQLGHARAARRTGYPMTGIQLWGLLSASQYPPAEPVLPPAVHIRRALGGPLASGLLALIAGLAAGRAGRGPGRGCLWFIFWENLLVFTLGAFVPLGFNDGSTLLHWWGVQRRQRRS